MRRPSWSERLKWTIERWSGLWWGSFPATWCEDEKKLRERGPRPLFALIVRPSGSDFLRIELTARRGHYLTWGHEATVGQKIETKLYGVDLLERFRVTS